ncbi:hypothetical protein GF373_04400, partial [bacterium]|nr:hypothetical protein [bacterium]
MVYLLYTKRFLYVWFAFLVFTQVSFAQTESPVESPTDIPVFTPTATESPVIVPTESPVVTPTVTPTESPVETPTLRPTLPPRNRPAGIVSIAGTNGLVGKDIVVPVLVQRALDLRQFSVDVIQVPPKTESPTETSTETPFVRLLQLKKVETQRTKTHRFRSVKAVPLAEGNGVRILADSGRRAGVSGKGVLFKLIYKPLLPGRTDLRLDSLAGDLSNSVVAKRGGRVVIGTRGKKGDVDLDGQVSGNDALLLMKYLIGLVDLDPMQKLAADCNKDKKINIRDVQCIFRRSIGIDSTNPSAKVVRPMQDPLAAGSLTLPNQTVNAGSSFQLDVQIDAASNIESFAFDFTYDSSRLEFVSAQAAGVTSGFLVFGDEISPGQATIIGTQGLAAAANGSGTFITLQLRAKSGAEGSASVGLENLLDGLEGASSQGAVITIQEGTAQPTPTPTPVAGEGGDFTVSTGTATLSSGQTGNVSLGISGLPSPINSYTLDFVYDDTLLSFVGIETEGTLSQGWSSGSNQVEDGRV